MTDLEKELVITEYYHATLCDFIEGVSLEITQRSLAYFEAIDDYLACEGIKKAINKYTKIKSNEQV